MLWWVLGSFLIGFVCGSLISSNDRRKQRKDLITLAWRTRKNLIEKLKRQRELVRSKSNVVAQLQRECSWIEKKYQDMLSLKQNG